MKENIEELRCYKCGRRLDGDDCDMEDGKPSCVEDCPLTEEQWKAQFGDFDVIGEPLE